MVGAHDAAEGVVGAHDAAEGVVGPKELVVAAHDLVHLVVAAAHDEIEDVVAVHGTKLNLLWLPMTPQNLWATFHFIFQQNTAVSQK